MDSRSSSNNDTGRVVALGKEVLAVLAFGAAVYLVWVVGHMVFFRIIG